MTALEQELLKELEQEKALNTTIIDKLEKQETNFLKFLQNQQTAYEKNLSQIVENYEKNMQTIQETYSSELELLRTNTSKLFKNQKAIYSKLETLNTNLTDIPNLENLEEGLRTLSNLQGN